MLSAQNLRLLRKEPPLAFWMQRWDAAATAQWIAQLLQRLEDLQSTSVDNNYRMRNDARAKKASCSHLTSPPVRPEFDFDAICRPEGNRTANVKRASKQMVIARGLGRAQTQRRTTPSNSVTVVLLFQLPLALCFFIFTPQHALVCRVRRRCGISTCLSVCPSDE